MGTLTFPIVLTIARIVLLPIIIVVFYLDYQWARPLSCLIFVVLVRSSILWPTN